VETRLIHRNDLAVATARSTTFDTKGRALTGLTNAGERRSAELRTKSLSETDGGGGLSFAQRGRCDSNLR